MKVKIDTSARKKIAIKIRKKIAKTGKMRITVHKTNKHIYSQIIDVNGKVMAAASSLQAKTKQNNKEEETKKINDKTAKAARVGVELAKLAKDNNIHEHNLAFDRSGFIYHGRIKALADAAREAGLKF